jgi:zinc protease
MTTVTAQSLPSASTVVRETLPNGITVLVYENFAAQSVVVTGSLHGGAIYEALSQPGLANLTASALMRGTRSRDFFAIHSALEDIGADVNVYAGSHRANFGGKSLAEDLSILIDVLADVLREPIFPTEQVERLRGEVLTGLQIRNLDTRYRAARLFSETLYPEGHPYRTPLHGTIESVSALKLDDLRAFHARQYAPNGMVVVIVGAVKADDALKIVRDRLGDWQNPNQPPVASVETPPSPAETRRAFTAVPGKSQSDLVVGTIGLSRTDPDYFAAMLANSVLGQFGMMGRVGASVREELGLAYYVYSQLDAGMGAGPWSVTAGVNPANVDLAIARITDEIRRLVETPVSADELSDNQSYFIGHLPLQLESNEGIATTLHSMELYNLGLDYLLEYPERIAALTAADLQRAAQRLLNPEALTIAVAGPA